MDKAKRAQTAETLKQPSLRLTLRAPYLYPDYHWGRYRGIAQDMKLPPLSELLLRNVFFDTCVYHQPGIDLLAKVIPIDNILFASEMVGAVRGIDPETNHYYHDTRRYIDHVAAVSDEDRRKIFEGNARKVYGRLDAYLEGRSHSRESSSRPEPALQ